MTYRNNADIDRELVAGALDGQKHEALDALYRKYRDRIRLYVFRFLGNYHDAEEIAQDTFYRAFSRLDSYDLGIPLLLGSLPLQEDSPVIEQEDLTIEAVN